MDVECPISYVKEINTALNTTQCEDLSSGDHLLLESKPVPPQDEIALQQDECGKDDCDKDRIIHEKNAIAIQNCEKIGGDPLSLSDTSPPTLTVAHSSSGIDEEVGLSSSIPMSIINTSSDSVIHYNDILTSSAQTDPIVAQYALNDEENPVVSDSNSSTKKQLAEGYKRTLHECENQDVSLEHSSQTLTDVCSPVISPQVATQSLSPLDTVNLEQEMQVTHDTEISCLDSEQSHPVDSTSVSGQCLSVGEEGTTNKVDDRSLEQFSEILLDSDLSQSDSETQNDSCNIVRPDESNKSAKKVRFADDVQLKEHDSFRPTQSPPLHPSSATLSSPEDVAKQKLIPVSLSSSAEQLVEPPQYTTNELIAGVYCPAEYLGSTPIFLSGVASAKSSRMYQAQQAVKLIKDPDNECQPRFSVIVKISTQAVKIADSKSDVDMMEHPLHTISYVADIDNALVIMAHIIPATRCEVPQSPTDEMSQSEGEDISSYTPKMTCHVLDTGNARHMAMIIGQAFSAAYKQFLRASGVTEESLEEAEYIHILNAQTVPQVEVESFNDRNKTKKLTLPKHKGECMGMMVMESGYGSAIPCCIIAHLSKNGAAKKSALLNVGDHIISINGVNLVGMPKKTCIEQIKKCRHQNIVKMVVCSCPAVVEVTIVRPDLKYQLGFSVQKGMITSLLRGSIGERSGIRVGHHIIEINGTSTVSMQHGDIVHLLSSTVGDLHLKTMPDLMYKLLTGKVVPDCH